MNEKLKGLVDQVHELERIWQETGIELSPFKFLEGFDNDKIALSLTLFDSRNPYQAEYYFRCDGKVDHDSYRTGALFRNTLATWQEGVKSMADALIYFLLIQSIANGKCREELTRFIFQDETPIGEREAETTEQADKNSRTVWMDPFDL